MKILTEEEIKAHHYHTLSGAIKGGVIGLAISGFIFKIVPLKFPKFNPSRMTPSIKTALFISPPTLFASICAEEASNSFDRVMYGTGNSRELIEEHQRWSKLSLSDKILESSNKHKYKIIVGAWAAAMYGSWRVVDRDPIMTKTQKIVQARMYAQGLTVLLLLGSVGLSMYESKRHPETHSLDTSRRWENLIEQAEQQEAAAKLTQRSNDDRIKGKIFK
ncbi:HER181Wp [Eremothecium sinecaudum]|uniref:HER181Wp n=1 Tax=Eremothecium sinecaudum TaxID=45286 RepID=A0A0X8HU04_9SACH|nr:HER181Wp [Eremothecium sinecaudum]AMD21460.1 HER181Wp [Eremothecium sinecaudum]